MEVVIEDLQIKKSVKIEDIRKRKDYFKKKEVNYLN